MKQPLGILLVVAAFSATLMAEDSSPMRGKSYLQAGFNGYSYNYSEIWDAKTLGLLGITSWTGTPKSNENGFTPTFHATGRLYSKISPFYGGFLFEIGGAKHTYDGGTQSYDSVNQIAVYEPLTATSHNSFTKLGAFAGPYFRISDYLLGIHAGILSYHWFRNASGTIFSPSTPETYNWYYLPVGIEAARGIGNKMSIGCNIEYRIMLSGTMKIDLSALALMTGYTIGSVPAVNLGAKNGFLLEIPFQMNLDQHFNLELKPWFELRPSGVSNVDTMRLKDPYYGGEVKGPFLEPGSNSFSIGMTLSLNFGNFLSVDKEKPVSSFTHP
jgi:hypothetical protein